MNWDLLLRYINNESDIVETQRVEAWLAQHAEYRQLLNYLQKRKEQLEQPLKQSDVHEQWLLLLDRIFGQQQPDQHSSNGYWFMGIAAASLLLVTMGWFLRQEKNGALRTLTIHTPANRRGRLTLPDSSEVYLAPNSTIIYNTAFGSKKRELQLKGEAFFSVKHNTQQPFIISAENNIKVTVLGTSFNVYSRNHHNTEVKVATGLVGVTRATQTRFLKAGQQLSYQIANGQVLISTVNHNEAVALQKETLFFKNNNADGIAEKLRRWYNINIEVLPTAYKHPRFSGEMKDAGISNLMKGLSYATGLKYRYTTPNTIQLF